MKSPFTCCEKAFGAFYDEHVVITHGGERQTVPVCVFTDMTGDPLSDADMDTDREDLYLVFPERFWSYVSKLVRGDSVERTAENGVAYRVQEPRHDALMGWCLRVRSV